MDRHKFLIDADVGNVKRPLIRYHGGKFRLAQWVMQFFPPHRIYVEAFGGAASVLLQKSRSYSEVYNDLDEQVVNLFEVMRDATQRDKLVEQLAFTPYARNEFNTAWVPGGDAIERARRLIIRAQMGFGSAGATKGTTGFRIDAKRQYETAMHSWAQYPDKTGPTTWTWRIEMVVNNESWATPATIHTSATSSIAAIEQAMTPLILRLARLAGNPGKPDSARRSAKYLMGTLLSEVQKPSQTTIINAVRELLGGNG